MPETPPQPLFSAIKNIPRVKPKNKDVRPREYLFEKEIEDLRKAARVGSKKHGHRDDTLILLMFRHALRVSEAINLRWSQIDLGQGLIHVNRLKDGIPSQHPLRGEEIRALRRVQRDYPDAAYVFVTQQKSPISSRSAFNIIATAGTKAGIPFPVHPHMLRHSTGYYLANNGNDTRSIQVYMGHKNINNTLIYTNISSDRFKNFWKD